MAMEAQYPYALIGEIAPKSELTYNNGSASPSKKRTRDFPSYYSLQDPLMELQNMSYGNLNATSLSPAKMARVVDSGFPSTSGRADIMASYFNQFNSQTDALVQLQMERMRFAIKEVTKRQYMSIVTTMEKQFANVLREKQDELEKVSRYNAELEQRLNQFNAEKQVWFNMAKNSEAVISSLKSDLEQVLLQKNLNNGLNKSSVIEGCGDSDEAESCCNGAENNRVSDKFVCKVCHEKESSILVLPCRHLSVCDGCEMRIDACPVCFERKKSSVPVLFG
ncbi:hypothetical protein LUZ60_007857 [Juncus effusus]|nr:hypothetical protein LUZ60_007857 [Juncus effusus]